MRSSSRAAGDVGIRLRGMARCYLSSRTSPNWPLQMKEGNAVCLVLGNCQCGSLGISSGNATAGGPATTEGYVGGDPEVQARREQKSGISWVDFVLRAAFSALSVSAVPLDEPLCALSHARGQY